MRHRGKPGERAPCVAAREWLLQPALAELGCRARRSPDAGLGAAERHPRRHGSHKWESGGRGANDQPHRRPGHRRGDYDPASGADLTQVARLRLTDQANGYGGVPATVADVDFPVPIDCAPTADASIGSTCTATTTADTLMPGLIREQRQAVVQIFRVRVYDSGRNGTRENGTGDDKELAHGGIFTP
jgi:hypothetical protein